MPRVISITSVEAPGMTPFSFLPALLAIWLHPPILAVAQDEPPRSLDPRLTIELFAEDPQIVTPTGIDVDHAGRVWAIESNTHFPPEGYKGHASDRVLVMEDTDGDRKADRITVFKDELTHTMSIAVEPVWLELEKTAGEQRSKGDGENDKNKPSLLTLPRSPAPPLPRAVFIATRREVLLCRDTDGDLKCDETKQLVHLETTGDYPHNGLAGFAFDPMGYMYFGFGENLGADYSIIGSDGTTLTGGGEGGNLYRCRPDGTQLERWATGFWNPHASCFDAFGHLFTVDNDPDSRPPCRLLHIVHHGDYGYRFRNGRKGTHPFTSWNGEVPGTLPMVSGTGESPSGIVCYEADAFPKEYLGTLLVGSWGDHRIDKFVLKPRGASFEAIPQPVIKGGENFRPVGLALAPDGSLYFTDWVLKDYNVHGKGRIWRVSAKENSGRAIVEVDAGSANLSVAELEPLLDAPEIPVRRTAARAMAETDEGRKRLTTILNSQTRSRNRVETLWALALVPGNADLFRAFEESNRFLTACDEVSEAAIRLLGASRYSRPLPNLYEDSQLLDLTIRSLGTENPKARVAGEWLENHPELEGNLAGIELLLAYENPDPFMQLHARRRLFSRAVNGQGRKASTEHNRFLPEQPGAALSMLLLERQHSPGNLDLLRHALQSRSNDVRRAAVQWAGEEGLTELRMDVEKVLASEPMTTDLFMACLASLSLLDGLPPAEFEKAPPAEHILPIVRDAKRSASLRAIALRILPASMPELDGKLLAELAASSDTTLQREAIATLGHSKVPERDEILSRIMLDESLDLSLRADAVAGLASVDPQAGLKDMTRDLLLSLLRDDQRSLGIEALRSLRAVARVNADSATGDQKVQDTLIELDTQIRTRTAEFSLPFVEALQFALGNHRDAKLSASQLQDLKSQISDSKSSLPGDPEAGRRTFFHVNSAGCYKCHAVGGRGGQVGPDLTVIARTMDRQKLIDSILEPS
jgi:putative membrane-bound dehydrogenase-like protein